MVWPHFFWKLLAIYFYGTVSQDEASFFTGVPGSARSIIGRQFDFIHDIVHMTNIHAIKFTNVIVITVLPDRILNRSMHIPQISLLWKMSNDMITNTFRLVNITVDVSDTCCNSLKKYNCMVCYNNSISCIKVIFTTVFFKKVHLALYMQKCMIY